MNELQLESKSQRAHYFAAQVFVGILLLVLSFLSDTLGPIVYISSMALLIAKISLDIKLHGVGLFSLFCVLLFFPLWVLVVFWPIGMVAPFDTGLIEEHHGYLFASYLYMSTTFSLIGVVNHQKIRQWEEQSLSRVTATEGRFPQLLFSILVPAVAIISKPSIPFTKTYAESAAVPSLLPGNAWILLGSLLCFFLFLKSSSLFSRLMVLFFLFWVIGNFSRVEILGVLVFWLFLVAKERGVGRTLLFSLCVVSLFGLIGAMRATASLSGLSIPTTLAVEALNNSTVQNIVYGSAAYAEHVAKFGHSFTVIDLAQRTFLPSLLTGELQFSSLMVREHVHFNLGSFFSNELFLNFGTLGILGAPFALYLVTFSLGMRLLKKTALGPSLMFYLLTILAFRVVWYEPLLFVKFSFYLGVPLYGIYFILSSINRRVSRPPDLLGRESTG